MIPIGRGIVVDPRDFEEHFTHASGPGGQNVNKVETAVQLRFAAAGGALSDAVFARLKTLAGRRMTKDGVVVIDARRFRTRERNRDDAQERLIALLREAAAPPPPVRRATKPTRGSKERRLDRKARDSATKRLRGRGQDPTD